MTHRHISRAIGCIIATCLTLSPPLAIGEPPQGKLGTLKGRLVLDGTPSKPKKLVVNTQRSDKLGTKTWDDAAAVAFNRLGQTDQTLLVGNDGGIKNILIWMVSEAVPVAASKDTDKKPVLRLSGGLVRPRVLAMHAPQNLILKNDDAHLTNFRGSSFNVAVAPGASAETVIQRNQIRRTPFPMEVKSDVQPWVTCWIVPCKHPYFAVTSDDGTFQIENIPLGQQEFIVWHERSGFVHTADWPKGRIRIEIQAGKNDLGTVRLPMIEFGEEHDPATNRFAGIAHVASAKKAWQVATEFLAKNKVDISTVDLEKASVCGYCPPQPTVYDWSVQIPMRVGDGRLFLAVTNAGEAWLLDSKTLERRELAESETEVALPRGKREP